MCILKLLRALIDAITSPWLNLLKHFKPPLFTCVPISLRIFVFFLGYKSFCQTVSRTLYSEVTLSLTYQRYLVTFTGLFHLKNLDGRLATRLGKLDHQCLYQRQSHKWSPWVQLVAFLAAGSHICIQN